MGARKSEQSRNHYNRIAGDYDNSPEGRFNRPYQALILQSAHVRPGDEILDIACGNGSLLERFSREAKLQLHGLDISEEMIQVANARVAGDFRAGSAENLDVFGHRFDLITVCCAFHHFEEPGKFLRAALAALKSGGRLLVADPLPPWGIRIAMNLMFPFTKRGDVRIYNRRELTSFFTDAGFAPVNLQVVDGRALVEGVKE